jgi:hypothetical protein
LNLGILNFLKKQTTVFLNPFFFSDLVLNAGTLARLAETSAIGNVIEKAFNNQTFYLKNF